MSAAKVSHGVTETRREDSASVRTSAVPSLRFKGFESAWISKELLEIVTFGKGRGYSKSDIKESGTPLFLYGRMYTAFQNEVASVDTFTNAVEGSVLSKGKEVVVPASGETAEDIARASAITSEGIILGGDLNVLTPKNGVDINSVFLALVLSYGRARKQIEVRAQGKTVVHVHNTDLAEVMPSYPVCLDEQEKIQIGFRNVDTALLSRQSALAKLQALKKSMLVNMFPQGDAKVPKIRFKGFEGVWEGVRLGDEGHTYNGLSGKTSADFGHGAGKYVTYMNVFINPISKEGQCESVEIDKRQNEVRPGDVFFTISSETPDEVGMSSVWLSSGKNTYLNSFCFGYRPHREIDSKFLAYLLRSMSFREKVVKLAQGISRFNISKGKVMDIHILMPEKEEQVKIGEYFYSLDRLIAARRDEIEQLKHMKAALLNRMFV